MNTLTHKSFREATTLKLIWNKTIIWHDMQLATVLWHRNPWKIVSNGATFNEISEYSYKPLAEFHTQEQLWQYIKKVSEEVK